MRNAASCWTPSGNCLATEVAVCVVTAGGPVPKRRARALEALVARLLAGGLDRLVLDHVDVAQQQRDRQTLGRALQAGFHHQAVTYSHEPAHSTEPMLRVPDAAAWCAGRRDRWRHELDDWATTFTV